MDANEADWIERYLASLSRERRLSAHTTAAYGADLGHLVGWLDARGIARWEGVDSQTVRTYAAECHRA